MLYNFSVEDPEGNKITNSTCNSLWMMCSGFTLRDCLTAHLAVSLLIFVSCKCVTQYGCCHLIQSCSLQQQKKLTGCYLPLVEFISVYICCSGWWVHSFWIDVNVWVIQAGGWHPLSPVSSVADHGSVTLSGSFDINRLLILFCILHPLLFFSSAPQTPRDL